MTSQEQYASTIRTFIVDTFMYDLDSSVLTGDFPLFEQGIVDSMGIFRLITYLQETFDIMVDPEEVVIDNFGTLNAITALVMRHKGAVPA